jgi:hypothetical protein
MIRIYGEGGEEVVKEKNTGEKTESVIEKAPLKSLRETSKKIVNVEKRREEQGIAIPKGELIVVKQLKYAIRGNPQKTITIGVLNRGLMVDEVKGHRAYLKECPYYSECEMFIIQSNVNSPTCSLCEEFQKHVLVKRAGRN